MRVVAAHAHHLFVVRHVGRRIRDENLLAAEEEGRDLLALGREHFHAPIFLGERRNRDPVVRVEVRLGLTRQIANHFDLLARLDVGVLHLLHRGLPVVAEAHLARGLLRFTEAEGVLLLGDRDQLLGRVRDHLVDEIGLEAFGADRVADDRTFAVVSAAATTTAASTSASTAACRSTSRGHRRAGTESNDALAQCARVRRHRFIELAIRILEPPREHRIETVVVAIPVADCAAELIEIVGAAVGDRLRDARRHRTRTPRVALDDYLGDSAPPRPTGVSKSARRLSTCFATAATILRGGACIDWRERATRVLERRAACPRTGGAPPSRRGSYPGDRAAPTGIGRGCRAGRSRPDLPATACRSRSRRGACASRCRTRASGGAVPVNRWRRTGESENSDRPCSARRRRPTRSPAARRASTVWEWWPSDRPASCRAWSAPAAWTRNPPESPASRRSTGSTIGAGGGQRTSCKSSGRTTLQYRTRRGVTRMARTGQSCATASPRG